MPKLNYYTDRWTSKYSILGGRLNTKSYSSGSNYFGQSGDLNEVYSFNEIDLNSIVDRIARIILK